MKKGFSLIELILSIVIIGLTMMAIPNLISKTSDNNRMAIIQESIMDAKTRMALISTSQWGCVNDPTRRYERTPIFGNMANFYTTNNTTESPISGVNRRDFSGIAKNKDCASWEKKVDDFHKETIKTQSSAGYNRDSILNSNLSTEISTNRAMDSSANNEVKEIKITTTTTSAQSGGNGHTIILRAYSANNGDGPDILTRSW